MKESRTFHIGGSREKLMRVLSMLSNLLVTPEDDLELSIGPRRKEKSHQQRKKWHAMLEDMARQLGYTKPQMKEVVKSELMGSEWITLPSGRKYEVIPSSEDEDRFGYSELIEGTYRVAAENGIVLSERVAA